MTDTSFDPTCFFDSFPRFVETSETGHWRERLNARYQVLIHAHRDLLAGARVLDLASHDGRFAFAALQNDADHVVGIDVKSHLAQVGRSHFEAYGVDPERYTFLVGDMFDCLDRHAPFDVVLAFGILYHINDHMGLFNRVAEVDPRALIIDTNVSQFDGAVIEVRSPLGASPPKPGNALEGYPTPAAFDAMFSSFGWSADYADWVGSGLCAAEAMADYREGRRVSALVTCPQHEVSAAVREEAIAEVLDQDADRESEFIVISMVAEKHQISPQALRTWVAHAQRRAARAAGFAP